MRDTAGTAARPAARCRNSLRGSFITPSPTYVSLLDHLVGAGEQRGRNGEPERVGGLEVDDQLVFGRRLHGQIPRLLALEDAIDVRRGTAVRVDRIRAIGDQAAGGDKEAERIDRGQLVAGRQREDQLAMSARGW